MNPTVLDDLITELGRILAPIRDVVQDPRTLNALLSNIGTNADNAGGNGLANALGAVADLADQIEQLAAQPSPSFAAIAAVLEASRKAFAALHELDKAGGPAAAIEGLGVDLAELLMQLYLWNWHPLAYTLAVLATVIQPAGEAPPRPAIIQGGVILRRPFQLDHFRFERLRALLRDPAGALRTEYATPLVTVADANAMADKLFPRVLSVLRELGVTCRYGFDPADAPLLGESAAFVDHSLIVYAADLLLDAPAEAGAIFTLSSADRGDLGLVVSPFGTLTETWLVNGWTIELDLSADVRAFAVGRHGFTLLASAGTAEARGKLAGTLPAPPSGPAYVLGAPAGTRIEIGGADFSLQTTLSEAQQSLALAAGVAKSAVVIAPGDGDGFLRSVLPANGLRATFDLGLAWSTERGLAFRGAAGLDATLPVGSSIGGVLTVPSVHLSLQASDAALIAQVSASIGLSIGPVKALVDRVGITGIATFPEQGANLGVVDLAFAFKAPSGVGLSIDAAGLTGGGFLSHDDAAHQYAGVLQLEYQSFQLLAFGLLATTLPSGPGYSLVAMIDAEFPPIQLGFGFTLDGAGGMLGVHRTASVEALRAGLAAHTLSRLLFPTDPIANAPQLLTELDTLFPAAAGRLLFGALLHIGWGSPTLLTIDLALVLDLPAPVRLVLIAELAVALPSPDLVLVEIHMSALGTIDFGKGESGLDAVLHDSRLLGFTLHGSMALRVNWSGQATFLLAVGGAHPKFPLPPGFPRLERVGISMPSGNITTLNLNGYVALSSNTLQIGAHVDLFVGIDDFGVSGYLNFDTLIQIRPFHFDGDISGGVALSFDGYDLMALQLAGTLSGPTPWHAEGSVSFDVLCFTVTKSFAATFGDPAADQPVDRVDVGQLLRAALADPRNFSASAASDAGALVTLAMPATASGVVVARPEAGLAVHQRVVPLGLAITRYGSGAPLGDSQFDITSVTVDGWPQPLAPRLLAPLLDDFAPAQFLTMSNDESLASPSFERLPAGVEVRGETVFGAASSAAPAMTRSITYEAFFVDTRDGPWRGDPVPRPFPVEVLTAVLAEGAGGRASIARGGRRRYAGLPQTVMSAALDFVVATSDQLTASGIGAPAGLTYNQARAALRAELALHPARGGELLVVAGYEVRS